MSTVTVLGTQAPGRLNPVAAWLFVIAGLIVAMIVVGGLTRLTDSGLSITEWKPVTGAVPPLSEAGWQAEFAKYQQIPEYQRQNFGFTLDQFKQIYWWEWGHRLLGRLIGIAFALPLIVFWLRKMLPPGLKGRLAILFVLGGLQGAVGWWMVASGLTERVDVSQHRLAAHLGLAFLLLGAVWWTALDAKAGRAEPWRSSRAAWVGVALLALIALQIILGAFVAGLDAGRTYTSWPLIDGKLIPDAYGALEPAWRNPFDNPVAAQVNHRMVGYLVAIAALAAPFLFGRETVGEVRTAAWIVAGVAAVQAMLGVTALVHAAPLELSAVHQLGAAVLFLAAVTLARGAGVASPHSARKVEPVL